MAKVKKKAASASKATSFPELLMLIPCDGISSDPNSGKTTIYGIFDQFIVSKLPSTVQFFVYLKLAGGAGTHNLILEVVGPFNRRIGDATSTFSLEFHPGQRYEVQVRIAELDITKYGVHQIQVRVGEKPLGAPYSVEVVRRAKPEAMVRASPSHFVVPSKRRLMNSEIGRLLDEDDEQRLTYEERKPDDDILGSILFGHGPSFTIKKLAELCEGESLNVSADYSEYDPKVVQEHWKSLGKNLQKVAKNIPSEIDMRNDDPLMIEERESAIEDLSEILKVRGPHFAISTLARWCDVESEDPKDLRKHNLKTVQERWRLLAKKLREVDNTVRPEIDPLMFS